MADSYERPLHQDEWRLNLKIYAACKFNKQYTLQKQFLKRHTKPLLSSIIILVLNLTRCWCFYISLHQALYFIDYLKSLREPNASSYLSCIELSVRWNTLYLKQSQNMYIIYAMIMWRLTSPSNDDVLFFDRV